MSSGKKVCRKDKLCIGVCKKACMQDGLALRVITSSFIVFTRDNWAHTYFYTKLEIVQTLIFLH